MLVAQSIERPGAADALEGGVQPERGEHGRVDRRAAGAALDRADGRGLDVTRDADV